MNRVLVVIFLIVIFLGGILITDKVKRIAQAFAHAEGFYAEGNTLPKRANNPGDLKLGDKGFGEISGKTIFPTADAGWAALYRQVGLMVSGLSHVYKPSMTISEVAALYTGADHADTWALEVAQFLHVTTDTTLAEV